MSAGGYRRSLARAAALPPGVLARRALGRLFGGARRAVACAADERRGTYELDHVEPPLTSIFPAPSRATLAARRAALETLGAQCLEHRFDLLGSGWTKVSRGMRCRGMEGHRYDSTAPPIAGGHAHAVPQVNRSNRDEAARILGLLDRGYEPIDWQLDFKSGHRWRESTWFRRIRVYGNPPGADVKVPWELGRCQHLPQLALLHALWRDDRPADAARVFREFRNQVLDFIGSNPPRFGVQWACPMDVAIRVANWLVAHDQFRAAGAEADPAFEHVFQRSVYEHALHVSTNLEWTGELRSNHYLADLAGLAFAAAHLAPSEDTDRWLGFVLQELVCETLLQFLPDGASFEASTSYHRLSAELVVYTAALLLALPSERLARVARASSWRPGNGPKLVGCPPSLVRDGKRYRIAFPPEFWQRLGGMARFTLGIRRPDGRIPQFGDNDGGRLLKLEPAGALITVSEAKRRYTTLADYEELPEDAAIFDEDALDHRHLLGALGALLGRSDLAEEAGPYRLDAEMISALARANAVRRDTDIETPPSMSQHDLSGLREEIAGRCSASMRYAFPAPAPDALSDVTIDAFPDFGLYLFRSRTLYLAVRCGRLRGNGAHAHNDQLAIELWMGTRPLVLDPGSYVYTALPFERNRYRSVRSHFAPRLVGYEPGDLSGSLFELLDTAHARCLYHGLDGFAGVHVGYGLPVYRVVTLEPGEVRVEDFTEGGMLERCPLGSEDGRPRFPPAGLAVSDKYGVLLRAV